MYVTTARHIHVTNARGVIGIPFGDVGVLVERYAHMKHVVLSGTMYKTTLTTVWFANAGHLHRLCLICVKLVFVPTRHASITPENLLLKRRNILDARSAWMHAVAKFVFPRKRIVQTGVVRNTTVLIVCV